MMFKMTTICLQASFTSRKQNLKKNSTSTHLGIFEITRRMFVQFYCHVRIVDLNFVLQHCPSLITPVCNGQHWHHPTIFYRSPQTCYALYIHVRKFLVKFAVRYTEGRTFWTLSHTFPTHTPRFQCQSATRKTELLCNLRYDKQENSATFIVVPL